MWNTNCRGNWWRRLDSGQRGPSPDQDCERELSVRQQSVVRPVYFPQRDGNSDYNALNLTVARTFGNGLALQVNYRWSKSIDTLSNEGPGASANQTYPQDQATERGPSDFDTPQYATVAAQYELPWYKNRAGLAGKIWLVGRWAHRDVPYGLSVYGENWPIGEHAGRAFPGADPADGVLWQSGVQFVQQCVDRRDELAGWRGGILRHYGGRTAGDGRNTFRGPRYFATDLAADKLIRLPENWHVGNAATIDLRGNLYNLFNTLNLTPFGFYDPEVFSIAGSSDRPRSRRWRGE